MVLSLPASLPVPLWLIAVAVAVFLLVALIAFIILLFTAQVPFVWQQIKGQMKRTATVMTHHSNNRAKLFCPKREGKHEHENTLTLPPSMAAKFDPSGYGVTEGFDKSILYHYYTKASTVILPKYAAACHSFIEFCKGKGIGLNKALIDVLVVENCDVQGVYTEPMVERIMKDLPIPIRTDKEQWMDEDVLQSKYEQLKVHLDELESIDEEALTPDELKSYTQELKETAEAFAFIEDKQIDFKRLQVLKQGIKANKNDIGLMESENHEMIDEMEVLVGYLDPDTRESMYSVKRLQDELKNEIVRDGTFIFSVVHDFVFSASAMDSEGVTVAMNIAKSDALEQNRHDDRGFTMQALFAGVILIIILFFGLGLAYRIFGV